MQQTGKRLDDGSQGVRVADLRAQLRTASSGSQAPKPPKARKAPKRESDEERAIKAEKLALAQHTTSLLKGGNSRKPYLRPGERAERKSGGLFAQLLLVAIIAGGVAYALDPTLVPAEWTAKAQQFISQYVKL